MKAGLLGLSILLAVTSTLACTQSTQNGGTAGKGGTGASAGDGGTGGSSSGGTSSGGSSGGATTGGTSSGGSSGGSSTGGSSTGGATGGSSTGGSGGGMPCGGIAGTQCDAPLYCDYGEDTCGSADGSGTCKPKPQGCPDVFEPVCACDGKVYGNACEAAKAGLDVQALGGCPAPEGDFPCGAHFCSKASQYCQEDVSDVGGVPSTFSCKQLPAGCMVPGATCACLSGEPCGNMCQSADGGFTLTCPGG
jgi:hypothetical protein